MPGEVAGKRPTVALAAKLVVSLFATVIGGSAAALANFVSAPVAAVFGLVAGAATFYGTLVWERRTKAREFHRTWTGLTSRGPIGENWPDDQSALIALHPEHEVLPFNVLHNMLVAAAAHWCLDDAETIALCVQGSAGSGKTRLGIELTSRLGADGVLVGWPRLSVAEAAVQCAASADQRAVLIIDDANTRSDVPPALAELARQDPRSRPRVVLIARDFGHWWRNVRAGAQPEIARLLPPTAGVDITPLARNEQAAQQLFRRAMKAYAEWSGSPAPVAQVRVEAQHSVALLQAAAFAAVEQGLSGEVSTGNAVRTVFRGEEERWLARAAAAGLTDLGAPVLGACVVAVALFGAADPQQGAVLLRRIPLLAAADDALIDEILLWVRDLYPQEVGNLWLRPHLPAQLIEAYVVDAVRSHRRLYEPLIEGADSEATLRALTLLIAASNHTPDAAHVLIDVVRRDPSRFLPMIIEGAEIRGVDSDLAEFVAQCPLADEQITMLYDLVVQRKDTCPRTAVAFCRRRIDIAGTDGERADYLIALSQLLWRAGSRGEAVQASRTCCATFRVAAARDPEKYLPLLAMSLHLHAVHLHLTDRRVAGIAAAREAYEINRQLLEFDHDKYVFQFVGLLDDLATFLAAENQFGEALDASRKAVELRRTLVDVSETPENVSALSVALNNMATHLGKAGRLTESIAAGEESLELRRRLNRIDPAAHLEELAKSCVNMAIRCGRIGDRKGAHRYAEDGTALYQKLVATGAESSTVALAKAMTVQSGCLAHLGRMGEAVELGKQAIARLRSYAARYSDEEVGLALAESLDSLGVRLAAANRHEEAVQAAREAVQILVKIGESTPAFVRDLAGYLSNLGLWLFYLGRHNEAEPTIRASLGIWETLEAAYPSTFKRQVANGLDNLGLTLRALGQYEEACDVTERSVVLFRELCEELPETYGNDLRIAEQNLALCQAAVAAATKARPAGPAAESHRPPQ